MVSKPMVQNWSRQFKNPDHSFITYQKMSAENSSGDNQENQQSNPMDQLLQILQ